MLSHFQTNTLLQIHFTILLQLWRSLLKKEMMIRIASFNFSSLDNFELMLKPWIPNEPSVKGNLGNLKSRLLCANVFKNSTPLTTENQDAENYSFTRRNLKFKPCKHLAGQLIGSQHRYLFRKGCR